MNTNEQKTNVILSVEEYFKAIALPENELEEFLKNPKNNIAFTNFENHIQMAEELDNGNGIDQEGGILPDSASFVLQQFHQKVSELIGKENKTPREEALVKKYYKQETTEERENIVPLSRTRTKEKEYYTSTNKAGYIDATIILIMLLNIGFIVAMTILGNR